MLTDKPGLNVHSLLLLRTGAGLSGVDQLLLFRRNPACALACLCTNMGCIVQTTKTQNLLKQAEFRRIEY